MKYNYLFLRIHFRMTIGTFLIFIWTTICTTPSFVTFYTFVFTKTTFFTLIWCWVIWIFLFFLNLKGIIYFIENIIIINCNYHFFKSFFWLLIFYFYKYEYTNWIYLYLIIFHYVTQYSIVLLFIFNLKLRTTNKVN